jgi:hypothetical protein
VDASQPNPPAPRGLGTMTPRVSPVTTSTVSPSQSATAVRAVAREAERAAAAAALEASLRQRFFLANPTAGESDWQWLKGQVVDDHLVEQMRQTYGEFARL